MATPTFLIDLPTIPAELTTNYVWLCCCIDFIARYKKKMEEVILYPKLIISQDHYIIFEKTSTFFTYHHMQINDEKIKILQELSKKNLEEKELIKDNKIKIEKSKIIPFIEKIQFKPEKFKNLLIELTEKAEIKDDILSLSPQIMWMTHTFEPNISCPIFDLRLEQFDIINIFRIIVKSVYHNNQIPWKTIVFVQPEQSLPSINEFLELYNLQYSVLTNQLSCSNKIKEKIVNIYKNNTNITIDFTEIKQFMDAYEFNKAFDKLINIIFETQAISEEMTNWLDIFFPGIRFKFKKIKEQLGFLT